MNLVERLKEIEKNAETSSDELTKPIKATKEELERYAELVDKSLLEELTPEEEKELQCLVEKLDKEKCPWEEPTRKALKGIVNTLEEKGSG